MAKITKEEYLTKLNAFIGEETSEETLALLEDIADSWPEKETADDGAEEWKKKYEELDETWKKRYRDRFFDGTDKKPEHPGNDPGHDEPKDENELLTYEDFFESIKVKN